MLVQIEGSIFECLPCMLELWGCTGTAGSARDAAQQTSTLACAKQLNKACATHQPVISQE